MLSNLCQTYVKPEATVTVFELLMMGGVSPETCWAIKKHWNNKFYYTVASCWFFLRDYNTKHESINIKFKNDIKMCTKFFATVLQRNFVTYYYYCYYYYYWKTIIRNDFYVIVILMLTVIKCRAIKRPQIFSSLCSKPQNVPSQYQLN
jgi:hypothetical protein